MAFLMGLHHIGTFLLLAAAVLLLITTISAPVVNDFALLKVRLTNSSDFHRSEVSFGTFGYCILNAGPAQYVVFSSSPSLPRIQYRDALSERVY